MFHVYNMYIFVYFTVFTYLYTSNPLPILYILAVRYNMCMLLYFTAPCKYMCASLNETCPICLIVLDQSSTFCASHNIVTVTYVMSSLHVMQINFNTLTGKSTTNLYLLHPIAWRRADSYFWTRRGAFEDSYEC